MTSADPAYSIERTAGQAIRTGFGYALVTPPIAATATTIFVTIWVGAKMSLPADYVSSTLVSMFFLLLLYHYLFAGLPLLIIGIMMGLPAVRRLAGWGRALVAASLIAIAVFFFWLAQEAADAPLLPQGILGESRVVAIWGALMALSGMLASLTIGRARRFPT